MIKNLVSYFGSRFENDCLKSSYDSFYKDMSFLKNEANFILLSDLFGRFDKNELQVIYVLKNLAENYRVEVQITANNKRVLPSVDSFWSNANYLEKELWDMFNINIEQRQKVPLFTGHDHYFPFDKLNNDINANNHYQFQLPRLQQSCLPEERISHHQWLSFGPADEHISELIKVNTRVKNNEVVEGITEVGYQFKNLEKHMEGKSIGQVSALVEKLNLVSSNTPLIAWYMSVEKMFNFNVSEYVQAVRMVFLEIDRVLGHFHFFKNNFQTCSYDNYYSLILEKINELESLKRSTNINKLKSLNCLGGVNGYLELEWVLSFLNSVNSLRNDLQLIFKNLIRSRIFMDDMSVLSLTASDAISYGITGPNLRACSINYDLRKSESFYFYNEVDFEVPLGVGGDAYNRILVRYEEINQSLNIISQILDNLPESSKHDFALLNYDSTATIKNVSQFVESDKGEYGFYISLDENGLIKRFRIKSPSLQNIQALNKVIVGSHVDLVPLVVSSLDICSWEHDK